VDERLIFETALAQRNLVDSARRTTRTRRNNKRRQHLQRMTIATHAASDSTQTTEDPNLPPFGVEEWSWVRKRCRIWMRRIAPMRCCQPMSVFAPVCVLASGYGVFFVQGWIWY